MSRLYTNNYGSTLNGAITNVATTIVVTTASGLPTITGSDTYRLTLDDGAGNIEVVEVTAAVGTSLTVTRGVDGTSGFAFADLDPIELRPTADGLQRAVSYTGEDRAVDFGAAASLEIPNGATPTVDVAGEIAVDTTITDHTGLITYHDGTEALYAVGLPVANLLSNNGYVVAYNTANNEFEMVAQSGGGGSTTFASLTDITITTDDSADDTSSYDNIRYLKSGDPLVSNGGMTLMAATSTTTRFYGWGGSASFPTPRMFANSATKYVGFSVSSSDPEMANGTSVITVTSAYTSITNPVRFSSEPSARIQNSGGSACLALGTTVSTSGYIKVDAGTTPSISPDSAINNINMEVTGKGTGHVVVTSGLTLGAGTDVFDAYEEGTFTPTFALQTPGDLSVSYTIQNGHYVRTGNTVTVSFRLNCVPTFTTGSGEVRVAGLPFSATGVNCVGSIGRTSSMGYNGRTNIGSFVTSSTNYVSFRLNGSGAGTVAVSAAETASGSTQDIETSVTYFIT